MVTTIGAGKSFGELGLINKEERLGSVVSAEECELLYMDKEDFRILYKKTNMAEIIQIKTIYFSKFLKSICQFESVK